MRAWLGSGYWMPYPATLVPGQIGVQLVKPVKLSSTERAPSRHPPGSKCHQSERNASSVSSVTPTSTEFRSLIPGGGTKLTTSSWKPALVSPASPWLASRPEEQLFHAGFTPAARAAGGETAAARQMTSKIWLRRAGETPGSRSEERRVGEECRSRGSP